MKHYYISTVYICNLINTLHNNIAVPRGRYLKNYNSVVRIILFQGLLVSTLFNLLANDAEQLLSSHI